MFFQHLLTFGRQQPCIKAGYFLVRPFVVGALSTVSANTPFASTGQIMAVSVGLHFLLAFWLPCEGNTVIALDILGCNQRT